MSARRRRRRVRARRSGAYSSVNQFQSALNDAQKCINLAAGWAKGYGRKAAALVGLGRVAQAVDCYRQGLAIEPDNATLLAGLAGLVGPAPSQPGDAAGDAAGEGASSDGAAAVVKTEGDDTPAAAAAASKAAPAATKPAAAAKPAPEPMDEADLELLSEFLSEATDIERKQHAERIIKYRLNPFEASRPPPSAARTAPVSISGLQPGLGAARSGGGVRA